MISNTHHLPRLISNRCLAFRLGLALAAVLLAGTAHSADDLEHRLLKEAPGVLKFARDKGYHNLGVLKFRVKKGEHPGTDHAGTLNMNLASRLELALILADKVQQPIGIVHDASAVAAKIPGASHLNQAGRKKLFTAQYPLAWGKDKVVPDAFVTGVVSIAKDLRQMTVALLAFDRSGKELEKITQFTVTPDADELAESGESFVVRGVFDGGKLDTTAEKTQLAVAEIATKVKESKDPQDHPLAKANHEAPVELELYYDTQKIQLDIHDGQAFVVEPQEGQQVSFVIKRKIEDNQRYGVVLKVNGENTLERQRLKDAECRKWILEPNCPPITVRGFQMTETTGQAFKVLSRTESQAKEIDYGTDVGTISLVVFREKATAQPTPPPSPDAPAPPPPPAASTAKAPEAPKAPDAGKTANVAKAPDAGKTPDAGKAAKTTSAAEDEDFAILNRGIFPKEQPANLAALKAQLSDQTARGLIVHGDAIDATTKRVTFVTDPTPVMSAVITYYPR